MEPTIRKNIEGNWINLMYARECSHDPPEPKECTLFDRCKGCPYPSHGFICWQGEETCLRTTMNKINRLEEDSNGDSGDPK